MCRNGSTAVDGDIESLGEASPIMINGSGSYDAIASDKYLGTDSPFNGSHASIESFSGGYTNYFESNRGIFFASLSLMIYFALAIFAYSFWFENWTIVDSLYFAVCTFTTIGFGDLHPKSDSSRLFTGFFAIYGICILGFFISLLGEKLVEMNDTAMQSIKERAQARATGMFSADVSTRSQALAPVQSHKRPVSQVILEVIVLEAPLLFGIVAVALAIGHFQGWTVASSLYFGIITSTTVGFGDLSISGQWARAVCIVALPLMVAIFCEVLSRIAGVYLKYKIEQEEAKFLNRQLTPEDLIRMDSDSDGEVVWGEFLAFMLQAMQKVDAEDIRQVREIFDKLDTSGDGVLTSEDLEIAVTS